ncbi:MAG: ferredoxin-type protein NapG [Campylobacterales bacterium]|nr:ferredoxin-type protein NapG [Campylobacterales bacterium]
MEESRRKFLTQSLQTLGLCSASGLIWGAFLDEAKSDPLILRPPAALSEDEFLKKCIRCGLCVEACPYETLKLAAPGDKKPLGMPFFEPRKIPCYMCEDIPCVPVCPTGALDEKSVTTNGELDINLSRMGVAVVDEKSCIAFWGIQCDACYRACPIMDVAIKLEYKKNERTGKHAFLMPVVDSDFCTGCGLCERACVTKKAAIYVLPRSVALGEVDSSYVKGWDKSDEARVSEAKKKIETTEISKQKPVDYLNDGGL